MHIPLFRTITLFTELLVTVSILYIFYSGYKKNKFPFTLAACTLAYEILFNISYMASRVLSGENPGTLQPPAIIALAIFHGIFSLLMFLALLVFIILAWINYKKGLNYFLLHKNFTKVFIFLWLIAVISGIVFYFVTYF